MSKYDELTYQCKIENDKHEFPSCVINTNAEYQEIIDTFRNVPVCKIKSLMHLTNQEEQNFNFYNNKQRYITDDYFNNINYIKNAKTKEQKIDLLFKYLIDTCGSVITPKIFKEKVEVIFNLQNENMSEDDYKEMIYDFFGKYQFNLQHEKDRNILISLIDIESLFAEFIPQEEDNNNNNNNIDISSQRNNKHTYVNTNNGSSTIKYTNQPEMTMGNNNNNHHQINNEQQD
jgi:hypothetical protein